MFYQIEETIRVVESTEVNENRITAGIIPLDEFEGLYEEFGFSETTIALCHKEEKHIHGTIEAHDDYFFGIINGIDAQKYLNMQDNIAIYIKKNLFLIVIIHDDDESIREKFQYVLSNLNLKKLTMERLIFGFLERLISEDYDELEALSNEIQALEESVSNQKLADTFPARITAIRRHLLILHNFYEQLILLGETLQDNENELFEEEKLRHFRMFTNRVIRLGSDVQMMLEYASHVKEAYHAQMDNNLNSVMEVFTVVAAIFLPLTLIAGWYGMNFKNMPELSWKYGYPLVAMISAVVVILILLFFKRRKLF